MPQLNRQYYFYYDFDVNNRIDRLGSAVCLKSIIQNILGEILDQNQYLKYSNESLIC